MEDKEKKDLAARSAEDQNEQTASNAEIEDELAREIERDDNGGHGFEQIGGKPDAKGEAAAAAAPAVPTKRGGTAWMIVSAVLAAALVFVLIKPPFAAGDTAVATVNGQKISKDELYNKLIEAGGKPTLDNMITEALVKQELKKANLTVTKDEVTKNIDLVKASFPSEDQFNQALAQSNMTADDLFKSTESRLEMTKLLGDKVAVSDADIKKFFDDNKASFNTPEEVRASHILVKTKAEAEAIKKELEGGADFATLAKAKSTEPAAQQTGGDLNYFTRGQMDKAFEDAAFSQKVGELGIVKSSFGYHVLKVVDHKQAQTATLDEKKDMIRAQLEAQKVSDNSAALLQELQTKAKITNTLAAAGADPAAGNTPVSTPAAQ